MRQAEIKVGGVYFAKVSNKITRVRVDAIRETAKPSGRTNYSGMREMTMRQVFDVTNLATGRKTVFRSAAKFRGTAVETQQ